MTTMLPSPPRWWQGTGLHIALLQSLAIAMATALLGVGVVQEFHRSLSVQLDQRIVDDMRSLTHHYESDGRAGLIRAMGRRRDIMPDLLRDLYGTDRHRIASYGTLPWVTPGWHRVRLPLAHGRAVNLRSYAVRLADGSVVIVGADADALSGSDARIIRLFIFQGVSVAALGIVSAVALGLYLRRRLAGMADTARAIMTGRLDERMPVRRHDEFDHLARVLNAMLERNAALIDSLRQVSSDIAHDLRTPLTRLRADIDRARATGDPVIARQRLDAIRTQTDEVLDLFAAMLRISEVEAGHGRSAFVVTDLSDIILELCESYEPAIRDDGRRLIWSITPALTIQGDRQLIAQLFINLLENAAIHTPAGSMISVDLAADGRDVVLTVGDDGPGIAEQDRARVLQRFIRLEASRNTPGHGLGLSLVAAIVSLHQGRLTLMEGDAGHGLRVIATFPAAKHTNSQ